MTRSFQGLQNFWRDEQGQDLIEYSLLITFIAVACAAVVGTSGSSTVPIWSTANSEVAAASTIAGS
jgi:Flp pilus assembly pilin Flp